MKTSKLALLTAALTTSLLLTSCSSLDLEPIQPYVKIGANWKFEEQRIYDTQNGRIDNPFDARIEIGVMAGPWAVGLTHTSSYNTNWPFNNYYEYHQTGVFVDYIWLIDFNAFK